MVWDADTLPAQSMTGGSTTSTGAAGVGRATGARGGGACSTRSSICEKASSAGRVGAARAVLISNFTLPFNVTGASSFFTSTAFSTSIATSLL